MLRIFFVSLLLACGVAQASADKIVLEVQGKTASLQLNDAKLAKLPQVKMTVTTPWHSEAQTFEGPLLRDVLKLAGIKNGDLQLTALNDYSIAIPVSDAFKYDVIIARKINGELISVREKGPLFVMYPFHQHEQLRNTDYYRRCIWQLYRIKEK